MYITYKILYLFLSPALYEQQPQFPQAYQAVRLIEDDPNFILVGVVPVLVAFVRLSRMPHQHVIQNACLFACIPFIIVLIGGSLQSKNTCAQEL
jgi:hypothetical protein